MFLKQSSVKQLWARYSKKVLRPVAFGVLAVVIFVAGFNFGNGNLALGKKSANSTNKNLPSDLDYASVEQVYDLLKANYDGKLNVDDLLDGLKSGLASATGDPYTEYFNKEATEDFENQLDGSFSGIGAELGQDADGNLIVIAPIDGSPASKAGLRPQDMIVGIDGDSALGMGVSDAVDKIRGEKGTDVVLNIIRNDSEDLEFTITRDEITIPSVEWKMLDGKVGYISISRFGDDTFSLMNQAAIDLKDQGVESILLDLRSNPGGLLSASVQVANMWLPKGKTILQEKRAGIVSDTYTSDGGAVLRDIPTAILLNSGSASASEILAGALHDNDVATIFGEKSYGKGSVQELIELSNGGEIKVTVARWYRPNGKNIDKKGIEPDYAIDFTEEDYQQGVDPQKDAALEFLRK